MTPIKWVYTGALVSKEEADGDAEFVPVLTLDEITAWLKGERSVLTHTSAVAMLDHLLAQVQAWRTQGDTR